MRNRRYILLLLSVVLTAIAALAQGQYSPADRQRWLGEMRTLKNEYLTRELGLSKEQQRDFLPLYNEMENEINRLNTETRETESRAAADADATDLQLENAARTIFEQKRAEGQIEMTYFDKFKEILTPRQLLQLKNAERKFTQQLVKRRRHMSRGSDNK